MGEEKIKIHIRSIKDIVNSKKRDKKYNHGKKYHNQQRIRPKINNVINFFDYDKYLIKDDLDKLKNKGTEFHGKIKEVSNDSKDFLDDIFFTSNSIFTRFKYIKNQDKGREINMNKKD